MTDYVIVSYRVRLRHEVKTVSEKVRKSRKRQMRSKSKTVSFRDYYASVTVIALVTVAAYLRTVCVVEHAEDDGGQRVEGAGVVGGRHQAGQVVLQRLAQH